MTDNLPASAGGNAPSLRWTKEMVLDVALGTSDDAVCAFYSVQYHELQQIKLHPAFQAELKQVAGELAKDGASFKLKAAAIAEEFLPRVYEMVMDKEEVPPNVQADLIKSVARWAGYDKPAEEKQGAERSGFQVNIILGGEKKVATIEHGEGA